MFIWVYRPVMNRIICGLNFFGLLTNDSQVYGFLHSLSYFQTPRRSHKSALQSCIPCQIMPWRGQCRFQNYKVGSVKTGGKMCLKHWKRCKLSESPWFCYHGETHNFSSLPQERDFQSPKCLRVDSGCLRKYLLHNRISCNGSVFRGMLCTASLIGEFMVIC